MLLAARDAFGVGWCLLLGQVPIYNATKDVLGLTLREQSEFIHSGQLVDAGHS